MINAKSAPIKRPRPVSKAATPKKTAKGSKKVVVPTPPPEPPTTPYDGTLALAELQLPGKLLFAFLMGRKTQLGHTMDEVAQHLGVSAGHLQLLRTGGRDLEKMETQLIDRISVYLGVPRGHLMIMAGKIRPEDYEGASLDQQVEKAVAFILSDFEWGPKAPKSLKSAPTDLKRMVVELYEKATGRKLVPDLAADVGEQFSHIQSMQQLAREQLPGAAKGSRSR